MSTSRAVIAITALSAVALGADPVPSGLSVGIPYPHPVITEVLFDVPQGDAGDASRDGVRDANGDEFVELFNPHAKPINLKGYRVVNRLSAGEKDPKKGFVFAFPACEVPPGGVVVLFNGQGSSVGAPVGNASGAPSAPSPVFGGAQVFVCKGGKSKAAGFNNGGDWVALEAPDTSPVDVVVWGTPDPPAPEKALRTQTVKARPKGSVQRVAADAEMRAHIGIDGSPFSPGTMPGFNAPGPNADEGPRAKGGGKSGG